MAFVLILLMVLFSFAPAWPADDAAWLTVDSEGTGALGSLNFPRAREYAIEDALGNAFRSALTTLLTSDVSPRKLQELWRVLYARRSEYIVKYGIIGESSDADTDRVMVRVTFAGNLLVEKLRALGYETLKTAESPLKDLTLTVNDVRSYEDYEALQDFLKRHIPCVYQVVPSRLSGRGVSFRVIYQGDVTCVTEVEGPFVVQEMTNNSITGFFRH